MANMIQKSTAEQKKTLATTKPTTLRDYISKYIPEIEKALPSCGITPDRFARLMTSALSSTPALASCTPQSFLGAMMTAASLGLEPNTPLGQAYLIPYKNNATFQLGYKGLLALCYRSGQINSIYAETVHKNDKFEYELGLDSKLIHKPKMDGDRGESIAYYAVYKTKDGGYGFAVMSKADCEAHRKKFSKAGNSPWDTNFDEMAKKTVLKKALKYAPVSSDLMRQVANDESVKTTFNMDDIKEGAISILDVQNDYVEADGSVVDSETGEIVKEEESK